MNGRSPEQKIQDVDVLIIGGGPAGLSTAINCAKQLRTIVVHKDQEIGRPVRTSGGSWFTRLPNLGIPEQTYLKINALSFVGPTEEATFKFGNDQPIVFDTVALYKFLAHLAEDAGATILTNHTFLRTDELSSGFISILKSHGTEVTIRSRFLIDASGFSRVVARQLLGRSIPKRAGVGSEVHIKSPLIHSTRARLLVGTRFFPRGYGWLFPMTHGRSRLGIGIIDPDKSNAPGKLLNDLLADTESLAKIDEGLLAAKVSDEDFCSGLIPANGPWRQIVFGRLACVGDGCGQNLPTIGEGIRHGIEAGLKLGECLARTTSSAERVQLREYSNWWIDTRLHSFEIGHRINTLITDLNDAQWDKGIRLLTAFNAEEIAQLLRLEHFSGLIVRLVLRRPSVITKLGKSAFKRLLKNEASH
jgi:digeranylgeranylglycerophospholipid reductase